MTDYIDKQRLLEDFGEEPEVWNDDDDWSLGHLQEWRTLRHYVETAPTVDAVPVVRCKNCKHFEYDHPYIIQGIPVLGHEVCNAWGGGCKTDENGYCFMAERRTDG